MSNNNWDPSAPPSSDLGATLTLASIVLAGAATVTLIALPSFSTRTMGSTTSAKVKWQQHQEQFQKAMEEQDKMAKSQDQNND